MDPLVGLLVGLLVGRHSHRWGKEFTAQTRHKTRP